MGSELDIWGPVAPRYPEFLCSWWEIFLDLSLNMSVILNVSSLIICMLVLLFYIFVYDSLIFDYNKIK